MGTVRAVFDTNVLIDYLAGIEAARSELDRYPSCEISIVTWMEVLVGVNEEDESEERDIRSFLGTFAVHDLDRGTAQEAISIRRQHRIALPDAVIWATARTRNALFVTRNSRDFPDDDPAVRSPYEI